jgi:hypothetical protein
MGGLRLEQLRRKDGVGFRKVVADRQKYLLTLAQYHLLIISGVR